MTETPRTTAGRETLEAYGPEVAKFYGDDTSLRLAILAIEAEAAQDAARQRDELREALSALLVWADQAHDEEEATP